MLDQDLLHIGLSDKEVRVYLAALELGQSTVQKIAKKAWINRATTYVIIENLSKQGLMSSFNQGKKQLFVAANPMRLLEMMEAKRAVLEVDKRNLEKVMPQLLSLNNRDSSKPVVKYFEGKEGMMAMNKEFLSADGDILTMAYSVDAVETVFTKEEVEKMRKDRTTKDVKSRVMYTYKKGILSNSNFGERRKVSYKRFPIISDVAVYANKVRLANLGSRIGGIIIEDEEIAQSVKAILDLAWEAAEKYDKEEKK